MTKARSNVGRASAAVLLTLTLIGCTARVGREQYLDVFRAQKAGWEELTTILEKIHDEKDMAAAKTELDARFDRFEQLARSVRELPKAPPPEILARLEEERIVMQGAMDRLLAEVQRVRKLPGGEPFLKQFEGKITPLGSKTP